MFIGKIKRYNKIFIAFSNYEIEYIEVVTDSDKLIKECINNSLCHKSFVKVLKSNKYTFYIIPKNYVPCRDIEKRVKDIQKRIDYIIEIFYKYDLKRG